MPADVDVVECAPGGDAAAVLDALRDGPAQYVLVHGPGVRVDERAVEALIDALDGPMAATASPVPVEAGERGIVTATAGNPLLPPPPTLRGPCSDVCVVSRAAIASVPLPVTTGDWQAVLGRLSARLVASGWRHVAAPAAGFPWAPDDDPVNGPANEGLATHRLWADSRARGESLVVDGACLTDDPHNGSQAVVWNVAMALKRVRPGASISLAVPERHVAHLRRLAATSGVDVIRRDGHARGFDVAYRPYQLLEPGELRWLADAAERLLTSQLDMIAFSNPEYHPSASLFHAVRNLQRHTMRTADGITFISEFGRRAALAECPDVDSSRTFVVACGADAEPPTTRRPAPAVASSVPGPFVVCISATFWHKNRQHAIRVFDELCRDHRYDGSLVIAGPEPYYGRSAAEDSATLRALDAPVRDRVVQLGRVDDTTKWWLLEQADLVLYPSVVEGFGLVPFEAASVGTPCLAHAGSALAEVLAETSATMPNWDPAEWANRAAALIGSPALSDELLDEVRFVASRLTWDATAARTWEAIDSVLARPRASRFVEEGGVASRVAGPPEPLAPGARLAHFVNRLRSYAARRVGR